MVATRDRLISAFIRRIPFSKRYRLLSNFAQHSNVRGFLVSGDYGLMRGSIGDFSVLKAYAETGRWAERTTTLVSGFLENGGVFVDVGANIGMTTVPVARNPRIRCIAVEPEPGNAANLRANVFENCPHRNVETKQVAVFSDRRHLEFEIASGNLGDHRIRATVEPGRLGEEHRSTIQVEALPLDEIVGEVAGPLAVKIDTQGAEPFVALGGRKTLGAAGLLVSEFWPYGMARMGASADDLLEALADFPFISIALGENEPIPDPSPAPDACKRLAEMVSAHRDNHSFYVDVIATREAVGLARRGAGVP